MKTKVQAAPMSLEEALATLQMTRADLADAKAAQSKYRRLALANHPDRGGSLEAMQAINTAWDRVQSELGKGGAASDALRDWKAERDAWNAKRDAVAPVVEAELRRRFDVDRFGAAFEAAMGVKLDPSVSVSVRGSWMTMTAEWRAASTVLSLVASVDLTGYVGTRSLGGDAGFTVPVVVRTSVFHDGRKANLGKRDYQMRSSDVLEDPYALFPRDKLEKIAGGKEKARKFSKRDMVLGLRALLGAEVDDQLASFLVNGARVGLWRSAFGRELAVWSVTWVTRGREKTTVSVGMVPESEALLGALVAAKKRCEADPAMSVATIAQVFEEEVSKVKDAS